MALGEELTSYGTDVSGLGHRFALDDGRWLHDAGVGDLVLSEGHVKQEWGDSKRNRAICELQKIAKRKPRECEEQTRIKLGICQEAS